jgi:hypothetical protein
MRHSIDDLLTPTMFIGAREPHLSGVSFFLRAVIFGVTVLRIHDVSPTHLQEISKPTFAREVTTLRMFNARRTQHWR